jgi:hypothetical protein
MRSVRLWQCTPLTSTLPVWLTRAADRLEEGALSSAVRIDHGDQLAPADRERDVVEQDLVAVADSQLDDFENGRTGGHANNHIKNEIDS